MRYLVDTYDKLGKVGEYTLEADNIAVARQLARNMHINQYHSSKKWYELPDIDTEVFELTKKED
jgi:hypothetical protein